VLVLLKRIGAPLKPRFDASGAGSTTGVPAPNFFPTAPPIFLGEPHQFFWEHPTIFFLLPTPNNFRRRTK